MATNGPKSVTSPVAIIAVPHENVGDDERPFPADGVRDDAGRDLKHQRDDPLRDADKDELRRRQVCIDDQLDAGDQPPAVMQHRPPPQPPQEDRDEGQAPAH